VAENYEFQLHFLLRLFSVYQRLEEILWKKIKVAEEVFVNCYNFNPKGVRHASIKKRKKGNKYRYRTHVKKGSFQGFL
jgi:hypothetical protein